MNQMYKEFGISPQVRKFCEAMVQRLSSRFQEIDKITELNQMKVLLGMQKNKVSEAHFAPSTGYGYNDLGRDTLEEVYASIFRGEAALVRDRGADPAPEHLQ